MSSTAPSTGRAGRRGWWYEHDGSREQMEHPPQHAPRHDPGQQRPRQVEWKLLFNQLFAAEVNKQHVLAAGVLPRRQPAALERLLRAHTCYFPISFDEAIARVCAAGTSSEAYEARRELVESAQGRAAIAELALDRCVPARLLRLAPVRALLEPIARCSRRPAPPDESFFDTPEGRAVCEAFAHDGANNDQQVALVLVPGYAAHTIKWAIFEETVREANRAFGRPPERPLLHERGIDLDFEPHSDFYGRGDPGGGPALDILHPMGGELGNTTGSNAAAADALASWIATLPAAYRRRKLLLLGYSKGAPIAFELVRRHPELSSRVLAHVSFAGVVQGTHVARLALQRAEALLRDVPLGTFIDRLRATDPQHLGRQLSPLLSHLDLSWLSVPRIREVLAALGHDLPDLEQQVDRILGGRELRELLDGARDMTPLERARWNLLHLDDRCFRHPVAIFNVSALTDVKSFVQPAGIAADGTLVERGQITPLLGPTGELDWRRFSLDELFLYLSSIEGFRAAPGGLYDTQVELAHTKTPLLDSRPLGASLTVEELAALWADDAVRAALGAARVTAVERLARTPRRALFLRDRCRNLEAIDLGEFRGHHWSLFVQALRAPPAVSTEHAVCGFPRRALLRALLQVLALYNVLAQSPGGNARPFDDARGSEGD